MTQEQKARAYDEALETARKINSGEGVAAPPDWTICEVIFPELKESERIKKEIIEFITYLGDSKSNKKEWLAWLEKQGNTNETINKDEFAQGVLRGAETQL